MCDSPNDFSKLSLENQNKLLDWIKENLSPIKSFNGKHTSYGLKHLFEAEPNGFYVTNGAFKGAMSKSGFRSSNTVDKNWYYNISEKSKCFKNHG